MKDGFQKKLISLVLCVSMILPMLTQFGPIQFTAVEVEDTVNELEKNVGNQAIFDWWAEFLLVDDATLKYSTAEEMSEYYGSVETGFDNWVHFDDIPANDLILTITDYYYDEENEFHWYRVTGEDLPAILNEKPWVLYSDQVSLEEGYDPYLVIYDKFDSIRIINTSVDNISNVRFVLSGPSALKDATIEISDFDGDYDISALSFYHEQNGAWSNALQVSIKKSDNSDWTYLDGTVSILYTHESLAMDTYAEDIFYGGAFLYANNTLYSACVTDRLGYDASDAVYTNEATSIIVFEFFDPSFEYLNETAYLAKESAPLYDAQLNERVHLAAELPARFVAGYMFIHDGVYYYWLEEEGFVGSPYFIAKASDITLGKLPSKYGDGRVTVTDKSGNAVEEIALPLYEKPEYTAVSSLSLITADVDYQWQIEVEDGAWANILGENSNTIKITFGMVATLLNENGIVNIRCESKSARFAAYSAAIPVSVEAYLPEEPDVVVSDSFVSSEGQTVTVTVAGTLPADSSVDLSETDTEGITVGSGERVVSSLDITVKKADGTAWQPSRGETVTVTLEASKIGLKDGDQVAIYHLHNGENRNLGTYTVSNNKVFFEVDGFSKFVFALTADSNYENCIGLYASFNAYNEWINEGSFDYFWLKSDPTSDSEKYFTWSVYDEDFKIDQVVKIKDYYIDSDSNLWFLTESVNGVELPEALKAHPWIYMNNLDSYDAEYDTLYLFEPEEASEDDLVVLDQYGLPVWEVYLYSNKKSTITAQTPLTGSIKYQWEICNDIDNSSWIAISGQNSASLTVSYPLVSGAMQDGSWAAIRCVSSNATQSVISNVIIVRIVFIEEINAITTYETRTASMSYATEGVAPQAEDKVIVTLSAVTQDGQVILQEPYELEIGGTVSRTVSIPYMQGYDLYDANGNILTPDSNGKTYTFVVLETNVTESYEILLTYKPGKSSFKVVYFLQNALDDGYTQAGEPITVEGITGEEITADHEVFAKTFEGFYQLLFSPAKIASDGSTKIEVYYDRLYYKILFDLAGGFGVQPVYARFGTPVSVDNPSKSGYNFLGWDSNKGWTEDVITGIVTEWDLDSDTAVDIEQFFDVIIPAYHTSYVAKWAMYESAKVTVVIWTQDADGPGYSYDAEETFNIDAKPGATISYVPGANICGFDAHVHGTDCAALCGQEEHAHTDVCYQPTCGKTEHTVHDDSCWNCGGIEVHSISCYQSSDGSISMNPVSDRGTLYALNSLSGPNTSGGLYSTNSRYYFKLGDSYYQVYNAKKRTSVSLKDNCGHTNLHEEHNSNCKLTCTVHEHVDGCYTLICGTEEHSHVKDCYSCGVIAHTHSAACKHTTKYDSSNLWYLNTGKTVSATVAPDGSTTLNVYYDRAEFTLKFFDNDDEVYSITARHGADISHHWPITRADGFVYGEGQRWDPRYDLNNASKTFSSVLVFIERMPEESFHLGISEKSVGGSYAKYEMHYMIEALPGEEDVVDYNNKSFVEYNVVYAVYNYLTKAEDFFDLKGFTQWASNPPFDSDNQINRDYNPIVYMYYTRDSNDLIFNNYKFDENGNAEYVRVDSVKYQTSLEGYDSYVLPNSAAPSFYEEGSMTFKGWYMSPQVPYNFDFDSAVEFDFKNSSMPSNDLILYAWWEPVSHEVTFYHSLQDLEKGLIYEAGGSTYSYMVPHGSTIQNPYTPPADPSNGKYSFVGWFYKDALGQEQMWDFSNTTVTSPVKIYAKWSSNILMTYTVNFVYVDANGQEIEIADPVTGSVLAGNTKTFSAKSGSALKAEYQTRYFPLVQSHSLTIDIEDESKNTYTFYYVYRETVPYTVYYLTKEDPEKGLGTMVYNGETYYLIAETLEVAKNEKAIVTENAEFIGGYVFDEYQKRLDIDPTEGAKNELYFFYEKDIVNGQFVVHYMTENLDGTFGEHSSFTGKQPGNSSYTVPNPPKSIANFTFDADNPRNKLEGTIATDSILELWVYYKRNSYNYKVQYLDKATNAVLYEDNEQDRSGKWESFVTEHAIPIENYTPIAPTEVSIQISASEDENIIIFYYEENKIVIDYIAVGGGAVSPDQEEVKIESGAALGSTATAENGYEFVGWFDNQNGTGTALSTSHRFIPPKPGSIWVAKTYYAIFREKEAKLYYEIIGPTGSGSVSVLQETVKVVNGIAMGSAATPTSNAYRFIGWFDNENGTGSPISTSASFKPLKEAEDLWVDGTTYYAKFDYNLTSLVIDKVFPIGADYSMDVNQSFIFSVSEVDQHGTALTNGIDLTVAIHGDGQITIEGLTVGKYYKITEQTDWSWRYGICTPSSALESVVNGNSIILKVTADHHANKVIFTNVRTNNQWLDGDSWCNNIFK